MQFKQYPSYKNSGVEWLGEVPEHWQQKPIWSLFKRIKRTNFPTERLLSVYRDYGVIPKDSRDDNHNRASEDLTPYQLVCANDLVINKMKAWQGSIAISELRGIVSPAYYIYQPKAEYHSKYIHFLIRSAYYIQSYKNYSKGIRVNQWDLENEAFTHIDLLLPSLDEQQKIVAFLDTETTRIDNLIAKQEKLIELLEEQRKSIISHAVTKGLNPNAPMKDSGVEWLGEVPEHWDITRLKNIGKSIIGLTYSPNEICDADDDSYLVLRSSNVQNGQLSFLDNVYVKSSVSEKLKIKKNDILICSRNGSRDLIGKNIIIKNPPKNSTFGAFMTVYRSEYADYVYWILNSYIFKAQAGSYLTTTVNQLTINNLNNMTVPFAPISEQDEIVEFLSTENLKFNNLISKQKTLIEKLKEYRASIISHAVTGKIDVREFGA